MLSTKRIAVIDTETNWNDKVMSIGVVIADAVSFDILDERYYILTPEIVAGGMYYDAVYIPEVPDGRLLERGAAMEELGAWLKGSLVDSLFAYNAHFDKNHLPELSVFKWFDIMKLAAYKQHNKTITKADDCCGSGRLKRGYNVEDMYRRLSKKACYCEKHNALTDARDELDIMKFMGHGVEYYDVARI